jgi:hypothetical protein
MNKDKVRITAAIARTIKSLNTVGCGVDSGIDVFTYLLLSSISKLLLFGDAMLIVLSAI